MLTIGLCFYLLFLNPSVPNILLDIAMKYIHFYNKNEWPLITVIQHHKNIYEYICIKDHFPNISSSYVYTFL